MNDMNDDLVLKKWVRTNFYDDGVAIEVDYPVVLEEILRTAPRNEQGFITDEGLTELFMKYENFQAYATELLRKKNKKNKKNKKAS
jgi:hypothetical protein